MNTKNKILTSGLIALLLASTGCEDKNGKKTLRVNKWAWASGDSKEKEEKKDADNKKSGRYKKREENRNAEKNKNKIERQNKPWITVKVPQACLFYINKRKYDLEHGISIAQKFVGIRYTAPLSQKQQRKLELLCGKNGLNFEYDPRPVTVDPTSTNRVPSTSTTRRPTGTGTQPTTQRTPVRNTSSYRQSQRQPQTRKPTLTKEQLEKIEQIRIKTFYRNLSKDPLTFIRKGLENRMLRISEKYYHRSYPYVRVSDENRLLYTIRFNKARKWTIYDARRDSSVYFGRNSQQKIRKLFEELMEN